MSKKTQKEINQLILLLKELFQDEIELKAKVFYDEGFEEIVLFGRSSLNQKKIDNNLKNITLPKNKHIIIDIISQQA